MKNKILLLSIIVFINTKLYSQNIESYNPAVNYIPNTGMPKLDEVKPVDAKELGGTASDYSKSISSGESTQDLIRDIQEIQKKGQESINQQSTNNFDGGEKNLQAGYQKLQETLNPDNSSIQTNAQPIELPATTQDLNSSNTNHNANNISRYMNSPCFQVLGYNPNNPDLERSYQECEKSKRIEQTERILKVFLIILFTLGFVALFIYFLKRKNKS